jgi:hypothetical protein
MNLAIFKALNSNSVKPVHTPGYLSYFIKSTENSRLFPAFLLVEVGRTLAQYCVKTLYSAPIRVLYRTYWRLIVCHVPAKPCKLRLFFLLILLGAMKEIFPRAVLLTLLSRHFLSRIIGIIRPVGVDGR